MFIRYAKRSKCLCSWTPNGIGYWSPKDVAFDEFAEWSPSLVISGGSGSTNPTTLQYKVSPDLNGPIAVNEDEMSTNALYSGHENSYR